MDIKALSPDESVEIKVDNDVYIFENHPAYGPFIYGPDGDGFQLTAENLGKFFKENM